MSSSSPPYPYYIGIPFNPSFFTYNTGTGLSESTANNLYLRKTVADTATAQETFTSGIITQGNSTIGVVGSGTLTVNRPITIGYSPSFTSSQIGYSVRYPFTGASLGSTSTVTIGSFSNTPTGVYLLTIGSFTLFDVFTGTRADIQFSVTNVNALSSFSNTENGGNNLGKLGVCYTIPFSITNTTNQLTVSILNFGIGGGTFSYTSGASCITRIA
jgi:hypothetical protein